MNRAIAIMESLNSDFFIDETGYYALAIDGDGVEFYSLAGCK